MTYTVYTYVDGDGAPLYVGHTANFRRREAAHRASDDWFPRVASTATETFAHRADALNRVAQLLVALDPPFNRKPKRTFPRRSDRRTKFAGFLLTEEADSLLSEIAAARGVSRTATVELLIRVAAAEAEATRGRTDT